MQITPTLARSFVQTAKGEQIPEQESCLSMLLFAEATELARSGLYENAETLIRQTLQTATALRPDLLELLAKVYAQQGRYLDAESVWNDALSLSPRNPSYMEGLQAIARERRTSPEGKFLKWLIIGAILAATLYYQWLHTAMNDS